MYEIDINVLRDKIILTNKTDKNIKIKMVRMYYAVSTSLYGKMSTGTIKDDKDIEQDLQPNEKLEIKLILPTIKKVSVTYIMNNKIHDISMEF